MNRLVRQQNPRQQRHIPVKLPGETLDVGLQTTVHGVLFRPESTGIVSCLDSTQIV